VKKFSNNAAEHHLICLVMVTGGLEGPCDCGGRTPEDAVAELQRARVDDRIAHLRHWLQMRSEIRARQQWLHLRALILAEMLT
jgi:hypothetical protein